MKGKIFLSYRREDSAGYAGRLHDDLVKHFGKNNVFMDIDQIEPGEDFVAVINDHIAASNVLLLLIGHKWVNAAEPSGTRRLDNPDDFVRLELAAAFAKQIHVIPVLVGGASMPSKRDLPESLMPLAHRQAFNIIDTQFHLDVERLIKAIKRRLSNKDGYNIKITQLVTNIYSRLIKLLLTPVPPSLVFLVLTGAIIALAVLISSLEK